MESLTRRVEATLATKWADIILNPWIRMGCHMCMKADEWMLLAISCLCQQSSSHAPVAHSDVQKFYIRVVHATEILIKSKFKEDWGKILDFLPYAIFKISSNISEIFNGWAEYLQSTYIQHHSYLNFSVQSVFFNKTQRQQSSSSYPDTMQKKRKTTTLLRILSWFFTSLVFCMKRPRVAGLQQSAEHEVIGY